MNKYSHLVRAFAVAGAAFLFLGIFQAVMAPDSFGQYGRFRGDHILEASSLPPLHSGTDACLECHEKEWEMEDAKHANVPCEDCHFVPGPHAVKGSKDAQADESGAEKEGLGKYTRVEKMPVDSSGASCRRCHMYLKSRPAGFPQIKNAETHIKDGWKKQMGPVDVTTSCSRCHNSHFPKAFTKVAI